MSRGSGLQIRELKIIFPPFFLGGQKLVFQYKLLERLKTASTTDFFHMNQLRLRPFYLWTTTLIYDTMKLFLVFEFGEKIETG
jgi:hypothetical protein